MMQVLKLGATLLLLALAVGPALAAGDSDVFDPGKPEKPDAPANPKPPKPTGQPVASPSPIVGNWAIEAKGNPTCGKTTVAIASRGGRLSGTTSFGGTLDGFDVSGRNFSFSDHYVDVLGNAVTIRWIGEVSSDGNSATARIEGSWQNGCTARFTRQ